MRYCLSTILLVLCTTMASAQQGEYAAPDHGTRGGRDSYEYGEARRQQQMNQQLSVNNALEWRRALPPMGIGGYAPSVDYLYVEGRRGLFGRYRERVYYGGTEFWNPWPYAPAGIGTYVSPPRAPQSIGQRQVQTGPNRWESYPVYDEEVRPAQAEFDLPLPVEVRRPSPTAREF